MGGVSVNELSCSWCGRSSEDVQLIEVYDDESELPTGTAPVCAECLDVLECE
jgi:hypothetical protein